MCITNVMAHGSGLRVYLLLYLGQPHEVSFPFRSLDLRAGYHNFNESIRSRDIPRNDNDTMLIFGWATMLDLSLSLATLYHLRCPFNQALCCHASARVGTMRFESQNGCVNSSTSRACYADLSRKCVLTRRPNY